MSRSKKIQIFLLLILFLLSLMGIYLHESHGIKSSYPVLSISVGEDIHETQAHSTADLHLQNHLPTQTDLFAIIDKPTIFVFRDPVLGFTLPPTRLVTITTQNSASYDVNTYPQMETLNMNDSKILLKYLLKLIDSKGWKRIPAYSRDPDSIHAEEFEHRMPRQMSVASWKKGDLQLYLSITRKMTKDEVKLKSEAEIYAGFIRWWQNNKPYEDQYLIEVDFHLKINSDA